MKISTTNISLYLILLLIFSTILQSCSGTLMIGTATLATKIFKDPRTIGTQINDKTIEIHIANALSKSKIIKKHNTRITNFVYEGNVLLTGQSTSMNTIHYVEKTVMNIPGTKKIYNEIRNIQPITLHNVLYDWWITSKINLYCLLNTNIKLSNIKIITENKEVFLLGRASYQEKKNIIQIISNMKNITHIIIGLTYTS